MSGSTWTCEVCTVSFSRRGTRRYRFCSVICRHTGQRPPRPDEETLRRLYVDEQWTAPQIAEEYGCDDKTAWSWLRAAGIQTRTRGSYAPVHFKAGEQSAFAGRRHTPEAREQFRQDRIADGRVPYLVDGEHWLKGVTGPAHPSWQGGVTPERQAFYASPEWKRASQSVWVRDGCRCQRCGCRPPSKGPKHNRGHVHHIAPFAVRELRAELSNLVLLCAACHRWTHSRANVDRELIA